MALFIGLMSGTSLDGVDGVLCTMSAAGTAVRAHRHLPLPADLRAELLALNARGDDELHRAAQAANALSTVYAQAVHALLDAAGVQPQEVCAVGAHGQTVRHCPQATSFAGYTLQLLNGALLAELTGIDVVCDFRSRDIAAGGEGAPLVPAFHAQRFADLAQDVAVLNLGGIANLTLLPAAGEVRGFDCGPANALLDLWCQRHRGVPYDADGCWAATGQVHRPLLARLLSEPFFARLPPKSTGRDLFHAQWLDSLLLPGLPAQDVMATLAELTARCAADAIARHAPSTARLLVCGGGAFNGHLMRRLELLCSPCVVQTTAVAGVPPDQVEAQAFAWLAWSFSERLPGNLPQVTGARGWRILGALYPA